MLKEHQNNDPDRRNYLHDDQQCGQPSHRSILLERLTPDVRAAAQIAAKSSATNEALPITPPSMSASAKSSAAFDGLTLPPYRMRKAAPALRDSAVTCSRSSECT